MCCGKKWNMILTLAILSTIVVVACAAVGIVFILSKQEINLEAGVDKRNIQVSGGRMWEESQDEDVKFNGQVEIKRLNELIKGNLIIQKHVASLKYEYEKVKLEEEHSTIRIALHMSTILAGVCMVVIALGCSSKYFDRGEKSKKGPCHEHQNEPEEKVLQDEPKNDEIENERKDEARHRVIAGMRKLEKIEIPGAENSKKDDAMVRCFACFSSEQPCGVHLSFKRCPKCLLSPLPCPSHK